MYNLLNTSSGGLHREPERDVCSGRGLRKRDQRKEN
jgi:hypothetical protein